jgi:putative ABC transport system permease protein
MGMSLLQDVKYGVRMLLKEPGFAITVVVALALGIGVNTTVFTLVNAVLFRGLPFEHAERVMYLSCNNHAKHQTDIAVSYPDFMDWRAQSKSFKGIAGFAPMGMVVSDSTNAPERFGGPRVTTNAFSLIGQKPTLGRDFLPDEDRASAAPVCILGYGIWDSRYGRDANILGRTIRVNDVPTTVVGVMPKGMKFPLNADLWIPLLPTGEFEKRDARNVQAFGRLADGATLGQARNEIDGIARRLEKAYPKSNQGVTSLVIPYNDEFNGNQIRTVFLVLLGAVGFVLMIACANVANLLLARSLARAREISIRTALGAGRWRVIRQLLVESILLSALGGIGGLLIAMWGVRMFDLATANVGKPYWIAFRMDFTVFAYTAAICLVTGILFGLAPALQLSKVDLTATLKEGGRGSSGAARSRYLSGALVVSEVALSIVLLVGAGLMIRSFLNIYNMTAGIHGERFLTMRLSLPGKKYPDDAARLRFYDRLEPRLAAAPGVESAAIVTHLPMAGAFNWKFEIEGKPPVEEDKQPDVPAVVAGPNYFATINLAILRGRAFTATDGLPGKAAVIVNQRFAAKFLPGEDPLGKRIRVNWKGERPWFTIVGVSRNSRQTQPELEAIEPLIYLPYRAKPMEGFAILARAWVGSGRPAPTGLASALRKEIQAVDSDLPVFAVMTLQENFAQQRWPFRVFGTLFAVFALIALLLSSVGLYSVMAYSASRRTQEIGVRIAMGAPSGSLLLLVLAHGLRQLALGLAIGLAVAFGLARVMKALLVQVAPGDPVTFALISVVIIAVGVLACWIPARWAMRVNPVIALRYE